MVTMKPTIKNFKAGKCVGAVDAVRHIGSVTGASCTPEGVTLGQALKAVVAYIDARPARLREGFLFFAAEAIRTTWPCKPKP